MLTLDPPKGSGPLAVAPRKAEIVLAENNRLRLELFMPLIDDLKEIEQYEQQHASLTETSLDHRDRKLLLFQEELEQFIRKEPKFGRLSTFLARAASLAARSGNKQLESEYLRRARSIHDDAFIRNRLADGLIVEGRLGEARKVLGTFGHEGDIGATLRLAALDVLESNCDSAVLAVERAVEIDPSSPAAGLFQGGLALYLGDSRKAIRAFRVAAERRPNSSVLHTNLALAHMQLGATDKAFDSLHRAVAFGPLNINAVSILADIAFSHDRNEEAIPSLRYLVSCEQKNAGLWSRLARATLQLGDYAETITALKHQASIESTSRVWNNLGVAYIRSEQKKKAVAAFAYAMQLSVENPDRGFFLAARNTAQFLTTLDKDKELLRFTTETLARDKKGLCLKDNALVDVYALHLYALRRARLADEHRRVATWLVENPDTAEKLKMWAMGVSVAYSALTQDISALSLIDQQIDWLRQIPKRSSSEYALLFNNVAFALAELGRVQDASEFMQKISDKIGREAYPTATKGLIAMREGKLEKGVRAYEKAIALAVGRLHKSRIRQKLYLEQARLAVLEDHARAKKLLERVVKMQPGEELLSTLAKKLLLQVNQNPGRKQIKKG